MANALDSHTCVKVIQLEYSLEASAVRVDERC